jgi:beta-lactamase regulating signal transducer with metallopeptidase domain
MRRMPADIGQRAFVRALAVAGISAGFVASAGLLLHPLGAIDHLRAMATELCVTFAHIASDIASISLLLLAGSAVVAGLVAVAASAVLQRRALRDWSPVEDEAVRRRVARIARAHDIRSRTVVFDAPGVIACSRGVIAPEIWISEAAVNSLSDEEIAAVIAHEHQHCINRDPAKRQLLEVLARALFAFPVVAESAHAFRRAAEYAADDAAVRMTSSRDTARALLRFADTPAMPALVQFGASITVGERVQRLLGDTVHPDAPDRRARLISVTMALVIVACITLVALLPTDM